MAQAFIGVIVTAVILFSGGLIIFSRSKTAPDIAFENTASVEEAIMQEDKYEIVEYKVENGDTWGVIIDEVGIDSVLGAKILSASEKKHDLALIRAGNIFKFYFNSSFSKLEKLVYDISDEEILIIENANDGEFFARKEKIIYRVRTVVKRGVIDNFLFETAVAEDIPAGIILDMAAIFGWDIDFASSVQQGDSFVLAYENRFREDEYAGPGRILAAKFVNSGLEFYAFLHEDFEGVVHYYNQEGRELKRQFLRSPLDYSRITSGFSYNRFHPILDTFTTHRAIDYAASAGTPVSATADGTVTSVGWNGGNGQYIGIRHANGYSTGYAHLSAYAKGVTAGAKVTQNQVIGFVGSTGLSTGPHLHYEMRKDGALVNPLRLDLPPGKMLNNEELSTFYEERDRTIKSFSL